MLEAIPRLGSLGEFSLGQQSVNVETAATVESGDVLVAFPRQPFGTLFVGSLVRVFADFSQDGELVDPGRVVLVSLSPGGTERPVEHLRLSTGAYSADIRLFYEAGRWRYQWRAMPSDSSSILGRAQGELLVRKSVHYYEDLPVNDY